MGKGIWFGVFFFPFKKEIKPNQAKNPQQTKKPQKKSPKQRKPWKVKMVHQKTGALKLFIASCHRVWSKVSWILTKTYSVSKRTSGKPSIFWKDDPPRQSDVSICLVHRQYLQVLLKAFHPFVFSGKGWALPCAATNCCVFLSDHHVSSFFEIYMDNSIPKTVWKQTV